MITRSFRLLFWKISSFQDTRSSRELVVDELDPPSVRFPFPSSFVSLSFQLGPRRNRVQIPACLPTVLVVGKKGLGSTLPGLPLLGSPVNVQYNMYNPYH